MDFAALLSEPVTDAPKDGAIAPQAGRAELAEIAPEAETRIAIAPDAPSMAPVLPSQPQPDAEPRVILPNTPISRADAPAPAEPAAASPRLANAEAPLAVTSSPLEKQNSEVRSVRPLAPLVADGEALATKPPTTHDTEITRSVGDDKVLPLDQPAAPPQPATAAPPQIAKQVQIIAKQQAPDAPPRGDDAGPLDTPVSTASEHRPTGPTQNLVAPSAVAPVQATSDSTQPDALVSKADTLAEFEQTIPRSERMVTESVTRAVATMGPEMQTAAAISRQITAAVTAHSPQTTQIRLDPAELGHVTMDIQETDGQFHITITAEKAETADLMRKTVDVLTREFLKEGFSGATLSFAHQRQQDQSPHPAPSELHLPLMDSEEPVALKVRTVGRLDLRL